MMKMPIDIQIAQPASMRLPTRVVNSAGLRRMLAHMGHKVRDLTRVRLGPLTLDGLSAGQSRTLTSKEIRQLKNWTNHRPGEAISPSGRGPAT